MACKGLAQTGLSPQQPMGLCIVWPFWASTAAGIKPLQVVGVGLTAVLEMQGADSWAQGNAGECGSSAAQERQVCP